jgi:inorganic pyrophosphatase
VNTNQRESLWQRASPANPPLAGAVVPDRDEKPSKGSSSNEPSPKRVPRTVRVTTTETAAASTKQKKSQEPFYGHTLPKYDPLPVGGTFTVHIEVEKHSNQKYEYHRKTDSLVLDRVLPYPYFYPFAYGYFERTLSADGDELDVLLLTDKAYRTGDTVDCRIVGGLSMEDEKGMDEKIFAVPCHDRWFESLDEDGKKEVYDNIVWFFTNYKSKEAKQGKWSRVIGPLTVEEAHKLYEIAENMRSIVDAFLCDNPGAKPT